MREKVPEQLTEASKDRWRHVLIQLIYRCLSYWIKFLN